MLGQEIGVPILLPRAVKVLLREPLAQGDFYPGDLLASVVRLPESAWSNLHVERQRLAGVLTDLVTESELDDPALLRDRVLQFIGGAPG